MGTFMTDLGVDTEDPEGVCTLMAGFGVDCVDCSDGQPYCIEVLVDNVTGHSTFEAIDMVCEDNCHPLCSDSDCAEIQPLAVETCD